MERVGVAVRHVGAKVLVRETGALARFLKNPNGILSAPLGVLV
jgi:hypothetical protein